MGVYIKGMEMPKSCEECFVNNIENADEKFVCQIVSREYMKEHCPLVAVPDHGDLIDRDEMSHEIWYAHCYECKPDEIEKHCESCAVKDILYCIGGFPECIPADKEEK